MQITTNKNSSGSDQAPTCHTVAYQPCVLHPIRASLSLSLQAPSVTEACHCVRDPGHVGELWCDCFEFSGPKPGRWEELKTLAQESSWLTGREKKQMPGKSSCHLGYFTLWTSSVVMESNHGLMNETPVD